MPEYDGITPTQWVLFLWAALILFSAMWWLFWRTGRPAGAKVARDEAGPVEIVERAWLVLLHWRPSVMVSNADEALGDVGPQPVHVPVRHTGTTAGTMSGDGGGTKLAAPDTDAPNGGTEGWNTPRISTPPEQRRNRRAAGRSVGEDGKHRYSANQIHGLVGGARADVLAQVRTIREDIPTVFRPLSNEQQQLREQLQLGQR